MRVSEILLLTGSGILAGICNAIAGGGTFFTFPVLLLCGLPPVTANATNAVAVYPGHGIPVIGYKKEIVSGMGKIPNILIIAIIGSITGTLLLMHIGNANFHKVVPVLLFIATIIFALSDIIKLKLKNLTAKNTFIVYIFGIFSSIYGGFFGAGLGIMMMACLSIMGINNIQENNALKNILACLISTVSALIFITTGMVDWRYAIPALSGAVLGGLIGYKIAKRIAAKIFKIIVIIVGFFLTVYFGCKYYC